MPKKKLKKFTEFCETLLPHETAYLLDTFTSQDEERQQIMTTVFNASVQIDKKVEFDDSIDKRKYSKTLHWIRKQLQSIDVDKKLVWISNTLQAILLDQVTQSLEKQIINELKHASSSDFNFRLFYQVLLEYRHYLLIRMRYHTHEKVNNFIREHESAFERSKLIYDQLHQATSDIIGTGDARKTEAIQWSRWLLNNFKDERLDGFTRYMSAIRYIFICVRYNSLQELESILMQLNDFFKNGNNYSKRLLVNFYDNMLVLYDRKKDYQNARYYGYLSIKYDHPDSIIYRNNLVNVLIKTQSFEEGLQVIEAADFKMNKTKNFHSSIGFIANYIRCLQKSNRINEAVNKGNVFLNAYKKIILTYRWHRFFSAFHGALLSDKQYREIIKNTEKFKLHIKEKENFNQKNSKLILTIYYLIAKVSIDEISKQQFLQELNAMHQKEEMNQYDKELHDIIDQIKSK